LEVIVMRELVKTLKALSDETRLRILAMVLERECCVCEVMQALGISQTRASRNLIALYEAGILKRREEGLWTLYSIDREGMNKHFADLVKAVGEAILDNPTIVQDLERLRNAERVGPGCSQQTRQCSS